MALPWWKHFPFGNGAEIEANRKGDCERFLSSKSDNYTIVDPNIIMNMLYGPCLQDGLN